MKTITKMILNSVDAQIRENTQVAEKAPNISPEQLTSGQKLADKLASQVGSWKFLICQSTILAGWVGMNLAPGVPHWDESINFGFWILDFRLTPCINAGALIKNCGFWILDLFHELIRGLGTRLDSLNFESSIQNLKSKI